MNQKIKKSLEAEIENALSYLKNATIRASLEEEVGDFDEEIEDFLEENEETVNA